MSAMKPKSFFTTLIFLIAVFISANGQKLTLLKDIKYGSGSSYIIYLTLINDRVVFKACDKQGNVEPWVTDGTPEGTFMLKEINPLHGSVVGNFVVCNNQAFFTADDGVHGRELWKTDGTPEGTVMVKDIHSGEFGSTLANLVVLDTILFLSAEDGIHGPELWRSGGTEESTYMVKDLEETGPTIYPIHLFSDGKLVYFFTSWGKGLFRSDGTVEGTYKCYDDVKAGGIYPPSFVVFKDEVYFTGTDTLGPQLWKTTGTSAIRLTDIVDERYALDPDHKIATSTHIYFWSTSVAYGSELWSYDGDSVYLVKDINPGEKHGNGGFEVVLKDTLIFAAISPENGTELWTTDGTKEGTIIQEEFFPGTAGILLDMGQTIDDVLYYNPNHLFNDKYSTQLCRLNNVSGKHERMFDSDTIQLNASEIVKLGDAFILTGGNARYGDELWRYEFIEDTNLVLVTDLSILTDNENLSKTSPTANLSVIVTPTNANNKTVSWSGNNDLVAIVDASGALTAVGDGAVIITATANDGSGVTATREFVVAGFGLVINSTDIQTIGLYPNPVKDVLNINTDFTVKQVVVFSLEGRSLLTDESGSTSINVDMMNSGIYSIKIVDQNNALHQFMFVKE